MKEKIRGHFLRFGPRRFVILTVLVLLTLDIINSYYLKLYWLKKDLSQIFVNLFIQYSALATEDFSANTLQEMKGFFNNIVYFFIFLILVNNLFFYLFYLRKKLWAQGYVLFYTLTAGIFALSFLFDNAGLGAGWMIYNLSTFFIYLYLYFGVKALKTETTLGHGKKVR